MSQKLITILLCHLQRSRTNVRKTNPKDNIKELAASIAAHGLLQNLTVRALGNDAGKGPAKYEVVAGARRLAALKLLAKRKHIETDAPVLCLLLDGDDAVEISLAENVLRAPLHPADQFEAFSKLHLQGMSIEDIAARFGVSGTIVRQRLKLAAVSPRLMTVYRDGDMGLDQLVAFTITDDHEAQERAWFEAAPYNRNPHAIRRALTTALVEANDRRARFVGSATYEAAGGTIVRDLFDDEASGYFADSLLLDRLTAEKLAVECEKLTQEGWSWVEAIPEIDYEYLAQLRRIPPDTGGLTDDEEVKLEGLCEQHDGIVAKLDDNPSKEITANLDLIEAEIDALSGKQRQWSDDVKANAGAIVSLDYQGLLSVTRGLAKPHDVDADSSGHGAKKPTDGEGELNKVRAVLSEALREDLSAHRTAALRATLAERPDIALTALLHTLVLRIFHGSESGLCVDVRPIAVDLTKSADGIGQSKAVAVLTERQQWLRESLPEAEALWSWLGEQSDAARAELLAFCVAVTVNAVHRRNVGIEARACEQSDLVADALALDMADWWEPTRESYLSRVPKTLVLEAVSEAINPQAAGNLERLKKEPMARHAEELLAGKRWLPEPLRPEATIAEAAE